MADQMSLLFAQLVEREARHGHSLQFVLLLHHN